jgi:hypothetical protein
MPADTFGELKTVMSLIYLPKNFSMKCKRLITALCIAGSLFLFSSCGSEGVRKDEKQIDLQELTKNQPEEHGTELKESDIVLSDSLDQKLIAGGKGTYELKCQSCHRLTTEKLVGPGWKDVTIRRKPIWVMNMITNVDMMLESDPDAQRLLEQCMVRMPNLHLSTEQAREVFEFMRNNDSQK